MIKDTRTEGREREREKRDCYVTTLKVSSTIHTENTKTNEGMVVATQRKTLA